MSSRRRNENPLGVFGGNPAKIADEEMVDADFGRRVASIRPFLVGRISAWHKTLSGRERANCDTEDALSAVTLKLLEKNAMWEPSKGKYITFAEVILRHELEHLREKSRTIHSPKNCSARLKKYEEQAESGTLAQSGGETANRMRQTMASVDVECEGVDEEHPFAILRGREDQKALTQRVVMAIVNLPEPLMAHVISLRVGIRTGAGITVSEVGVRLGITERQVNDLWSRGIEILKSKLEMTDG